MIKQGEITGIAPAFATVRIYQHGEPTSVTVNAKYSGSYAVADYVDIDVNPVLYFLSVLSAYIFPLLMATVSFFVARAFTSNILISEAVLLLTLLLAYILTHFIEKNNFLNKITVCTVIGINEE